MQIFGTLERESNCGDSPERYEYFVIYSLYFILFIYLNLESKKINKKQLKSYVLYIIANLESNNGGKWTYFLYVEVKQLFIIYF